MEKDKKIIIASHGELAKGIKSAFNIIVGDQPKIETICAYLTPDFNLVEEIEKVLNSTDFETTELYICTDMMGGSVNNEFVKYLGKYPFHLITNVNLAFVIDLALSPVSTAEELMVKTADELVTVKYVNALIQEFNDDLEDNL